MPKIYKLSKKTANKGPEYYDLKSDIQNRENFRHLHKISDSMSRIHRFFWDALYSFQY